MKQLLLSIAQAYKADPESVYNTWFVSSEDRLKAFRSIRRGVGTVVEDIKQKRFPNDFKGSSLEFVLSCIAEQKQVFEGAAHPFYWKPKLRIPDIYENDENKGAFGEFLFACLETADIRILEREVLKLAGRSIKGLGQRSPISSTFFIPHCFRHLIRRCSTVSMPSFRPRRS